jgi:hypothetical protein
MKAPSTKLDRRTLLKSAAGLTVGLIGSNALRVARASAMPAGAGGDFGFLAGDWKISHRRLKTPGSDDWDVFEGEATVWPALGGMASIEELRIPARKFSGMGVRLFHVEKKLWADHWVSGQNGVLNEPMMGSFQDGVGTFIADDMDGDRPVKARGVWDRITPASCRWHQATSADGGKTWEGNWYMDWARA